MAKISKLECCDFAFQRVSSFIHSVTCLFVTSDVQERIGAFSNITTQMS